VAGYDDQLFHLRYEWVLDMNIRNIFPGMNIRNILLGTLLIQLIHVLGFILALGILHIL
jgi:hypothetical protein